MSPWRSPPERCKITDWVVAPLGASTHLSHAEAMQWAIAYATNRGIPVIYERDETAEADGKTSADEE